MASRLAELLGRKRVAWGTTGARRRALPLPLAALLALIPPALFLWAVLLAPSADAAAGPTFAVTSTLDESDANLADLTCASAPSGVCTLRAAVEQATSPGGIAPWTEATVMLPAATYTLTLGHLNISAVLASLTIQGAGAATTVIDGNGDNPNCYPATTLSCRVLDMKFGSTLIASGLTIRNGKAGIGETSHYHGGGIHNHGNLTLRNAVLSDNSVVQSGWGGGGITNAGGATAHLENVTISGNIAPANGGGIEDLGKLTLFTATLSGNTAGNSGGGIYHAGSETTFAYYATVASNSALGGTGAMLQAGGLDFYASLLADNPGGNCAGGVTSTGYTIVSDATCGFFDPGDVNDANLVLGPLQDNGGGIPTRLPGPGSPALDTHTNAVSFCNPTDQRGVARPQGAACDSGAVEVRTFTLMLTSGSGGGGTGGGSYNEGTTATLIATPNSGQVFIGWTVDGTFQGWANPLTITMTGDHAAQTAFAARPSFPDLGGLDPATTEAILQLAARGIIRGFENEQGQTVFAPHDRTRRAQMAALIARSIPRTPADVLGAGQTWDTEDHGNNFSDRCDPSGCIDDHLWRNVGTLQHYEVAGGYEAATCAASGVAAPCYGPFDDVLYAQVISFITRSLVEKGYWQYATEDNGHYSNVPGPFVPGQGHRVDIETYLAQAGEIPGSPDLHGPFNAYDQPSTRAWFALALWQALNSYWGVDRVP